MFIVKIDNDYVLDDENGELRPELGIVKKEAKKFNTEKDAYSYARKYFRVPKNEIEIIKINSMKDDYYGYTEKDIENQRKEILESLDTFIQNLDLIKKYIEKSKYRIKDLGTYSYDDSNVYYAIDRFNDFQNDTNYFNDDLKSYLDMIEEYLG